jgi:hypothetical protein
VFRQNVLSAHAAKQCTALIPPAAAAVPCCLCAAPRRAKYELKHVVRTHLAANDAAFNCVVEQEDKEGVRGVTLSKELMAIAGTFWAQGQGLMPIAVERAAAAGCCCGWQRNDAPCWGSVL